MGYKGKSLGFLMTGDAWPGHPGSFLDSPYVWVVGIFKLSSIGSPWLTGRFSDPKRPRGWINIENKC